MSALPPKADDMCGATRDVCYGPKADIRTSSWLCRFEFPLSQILGLLQPSFAHAFEEFRHRAGGIGDIAFDPGN
jgi:hypothetical protein